MGESIYNYYFFSETGGSLTFIVTGGINASTGDISVAFETTSFLQQFSNSGSVTFGNDNLHSSFMFAYQNLDGQGKYTLSDQPTKPWTSSPYLRMLYEQNDFVSTYPANDAFYAPPERFPYPYPILTLSSVNALASSVASCTLDTFTQIETAAYEAAIGSTTTVGVYNYNNSEYFSFDGSNFSDSLLKSNLVADSLLPNPAFIPSEPLYFPSCSYGRFLPTVDLNTTSYYTLTIPTSNIVYQSNNALPLGGNYVAALDPVYNPGGAYPITLYATASQQSATSSQTFLNAGAQYYITGPFVNEGPETVSVYDELRINGKTFTTNPTLPQLFIQQLYSITGATESQGTFNFQEAEDPFLGTLSLGCSIKYTDVQQLSLTSPTLSMTINAQDWSEPSVLVISNAPLSSLPYMRGAPPASVTGYGYTTQSGTPLTNGNYTLTLNYLTAQGQQNQVIFGAAGPVPPVPPTPSDSGMPAGLQAFLWVTIAFAIAYTIFLGFKIALF